MLALEQAILRQDPELMPGGAAATASTTCPWHGLRAYAVDDADWFFGRERDVEACLAILEETTRRGPGGAVRAAASRRSCAPGSARRCGRAGAASSRSRPDRDHSRHWPPCAARDRDAVLLVDQCEEVFTLCADPAERVAFLDALVADR